MNSQISKDALGLKIYTRHSVSSSNQKIFRIHTAPQLPIYEPRIQIRGENIKYTKRDHQMPAIGCGSSLNPLIAAAVVVLDLQKSLI